jgi:hypothetical protein
MNNSTLTVHVEKHRFRVEVDCDGGGWWDLGAFCGRLPATFGQSDNQRKSKFPKAPKKLEKYRKKI